VYLRLFRVEQLFTCQVCLYTLFVLSIYLVEWGQGVMIVGLMRGNIVSSMRELGNAVGPEFLSTGHDIHSDDCS
jgi:hypothetical protein